VIQYIITVDAGTFKKAYNLFRG